MFNSGNDIIIDVARKDLVMETVKPLGADEYRCGGSTPLYDGIGRGIQFLGANLDVARQGLQLGAKDAHVAAYVGGAALRRAGGVLAATSARYVLADASSAAFTPEEREALSGGKKQEKDLQ
jgi:hypothetical protein